MWQHLQRSSQSFLRGIVQLLYPSACLICDTQTPERPLCDTCESKLASDPVERCPRCAYPVGSYSELEGGCNQCRGSFSFETVVCLGSYEGLLRDVVLQCKRSSGESLAEILGEHWAHCKLDELQSWHPDFIVPVPLHWWRRWRRGYNQSRALAQSLSRILNVPMIQCLRRIRPTASQARQQITARRENVKGAFQAKSSPAIQGKRALLIDDVLTSGSTANEATKALRKAGVSSVMVGALARAGGTSHE